MDGATLFGNPNDMLFRLLTSRDTRGIVDVHLQAFQSFFLTSLGRRFANKFYSSLLSMPTGIGIGAFDHDGVLIGFAVGSTVAEGFYAGILRRWPFSLIWSVLPALLRHPSKIGRVVLSLRGGSEVKGAEFSSLLSLAVSPRHQGSAFGQRLIAVFEHEVKLKGAKSVILTTDAKENDVVNQFYIQNGYHLRDTYITKYGRMMNRYIKSL
jgi:GNAT superfamily N-acetyltransferase